MKKKIKQLKEEVLEYVEKSIKETTTNDNLLKCTKCQRETSMKFCVDCVDSERNQRTDEILGLIEEEHNYWAGKGRIGIEVVERIEKRIIALEKGGVK